MVTIQQLEYFLAALDHGSFSAAAESLLLSQPSLSEQIRRLEAELGVALFARVGRGVAPTQAAYALRPHAEAVLAEIGAARGAVAEQRELQGGIASFGTFGIARLFPGTDLIAAFLARYPKVRIRLLGQNSSDVAEAVREGELEAGLVALPIDDHLLDVRPIIDDELLYVSCDERRLGSEPKEIAELEGAPLIMSEASYRREDSTRRQLQSITQRVGIELDLRIEVEDVETVIDLAARGLGDAIISRGVLLALGDRVPRNLGWTPFAEPMYDTYALIKRRNARLSPASHEFLDLADESLRAMGAELETKPPRRRRPGR